MKIIVLKNNLKSGLDAVGRATTSNLNLPVLGSVRIEAARNQIQVSATNLELAITKSVFGKVVEEGVVVVPYATLAHIVSNIASERIHLERTKRGNLELKTDNYKADIQTVNEKEFPIIPQLKNKQDGIEVDTETLTSALTKVVIAGEASDLRPEIGGVLFSGEKAALKLAATDSFRLSEATITGGQVKQKGKGIAQATVPLRTAQELTRVVGEEETTSIYFENNQALFETENTTLITRLIEGTFPDYSPIIPEQTETLVTLKREELVNALKLASSFASRSNDVQIKIKDKKILEIYSSDNSIGENNYLIPAKVEGPPTETVFNWRYLLDGVKSGSGEEVQLGLNGSDKPTLIKDPGDGSHFYILMPIKPS